MANHHFLVAHFRYFLYLFHSLIKKKLKIEETSFQIFENLNFLFFDKFL